MTHLRKLMLEELQRRNYSEDTIRSYIHTVEDFIKEEDSDSILALSLAGDIARCPLKRKGHRWAGRLSLEKRKTRAPTFS